MCNINIILVCNIYRFKRAKSYYIYKFIAQNSQETLIIIQCVYIFIAAI